MINRQERYQGAMLGLAAGDALGTAVEFAPPGTFEPVHDMVGGGVFGLPVGAWTDDTSMALCLAESLVVHEQFDPVDQMNRYVRWWRSGYWSSTGECFDIGNTVRAALGRFLSTNEPYSGSTDPQSAGNGSLMRLVPVPLFFGRDFDQAVMNAAASSRTTHGATTCVDACRYYAGLIWGAVNGASRDELLAPFYSPQAGYWERNRLCAEIAEIAAGSFKHKTPPAIVGSGYVVKSLEAALWALHHSTSFEDGALAAVNLGDDADTTGAIYGQLAGAVYGVRSIPARWRQLLVMREQIESIANRLCAWAG